MLFVDASSEATIIQGFAEIAKSCKLQTGDTGTSSNTSYESIRSWLNNVPETWLLVLDNADDPDLPLEKYMPSSSRGSILLTTRQAPIDVELKWSLSALSLQPFSIHEAQELFLRIVKLERPSPNELDCVNKILYRSDNLPLAIRQAAVPVAAGDLTLEEYCKQQTTAHEDFDNKDALSCDESGQSKRVASSSRVAFDRLKDKSSGNDLLSDALELLRICSLFAKDYISEELFKLAYELAVQQAPATFVLPQLQQAMPWKRWDGNGFDKTMSVLVNHCLIEQDPETDKFSMHPLVQETVYDDMSDAVKQRSASQALWFITLALRHPTVRNGEPTSMLSSHLLNVLARIAGDKTVLASVENRNHFRPVFHEVLGWIADKWFVTSRSLLPREIFDVPIQIGNSNDDVYVYLQMIALDCYNWPDQHNLSENVNAISDSFYCNPNRVTGIALCCYARGLTYQATQVEALVAAQTGYTILRRCAGQDDPMTFIALYYVLVCKASLHLQVARTSMHELPQHRSQDLETTLQTLERHFQSLARRTHGNSSLDIMLHAACRQCACRLASLLQWFGKMKSTVAVLTEAFIYEPHEGEEVDFIAVDEKGYLARCYNDGLTAEKAIPIVVDFCIHWLQKRQHQDSDKQRVRRAFARWVKMYERLDPESKHLDFEVHMERIFSESIENRPSTAPPDLHNVQGTAKSNLFPAPSQPGFVPTNNFPELRRPPHTGKRRQTVHAQPHDKRQRI